MQKITLIYFLKIDNISRAWIEYEYEYERCLLKLNFFGKGILDAKSNLPIWIPVNTKDYFLSLSLSPPFLFYQVFISITINMIIRCTDDVVVEKKDKGFVPSFFPPLPSLLLFQRLWFHLAEIEEKVRRKQKRMGGWGEVGKKKEGAESSS